MFKYIYSKRKKLIELIKENPSILLIALKKLVFPMRSEYRKRFRMKLADWFIYERNNIVYKTDDYKTYYTISKWMGIPTEKNPMDAWIYQEIVYETKPDILIEIGSDYGGSTLFFAGLFDFLDHGEIISIDISRENYKVNHPRITEITGDSSSEEVVEKVMELCKGKSVMLIHDGDHTKKQVLKDLNIYSNIVTEGNYLIVEDGLIDLFKPGDMIGNYEDGPLSAVEEFLEKNNNFIVDESRERYIITYNPKGFLKRIK